MAKSPMSPPAIARAAVRSSFDDDGDDDGGEEEAFDTDDDPFEDWDDLPSISPAGSPSSEGEGGIASLRSFTDTLRGEMTAEEEAFAAVLSGNEMEPERAFLVAVGPKGGGGGKSKTGEDSSAADALAAAVAALSSSSSSSPSSSSLEGEEAEGGEDELDSPPPGSSPPSSAASLSTYTTAESLAELASLAETAGLVVVGRLSQALSAPNPRTYVNAGKVAEIAAAVVASRADVVIFDDELTPAQARNLEGALEGAYAGGGGSPGGGFAGPRARVSTKKVGVCDRTALILDIFAQRAASREGMLQVELAQAEYQLPRLTRMWSHLERQSGGRTKGMGEKQIEVDKRLLRARAAALRKEIDAVRRERASRRAARAAARVPVVALVGYTSAGKSSLLNALTGATALADDAPFATLDPTTRRLPGLPGGKAALLTDTVGFIQKLPTQLVAAFRATLEEAAAADLLVHVVDVSHPAAAAQSSTVARVLREIGVAEGAPTVVAWNKVDAADSRRGAGASDAARALAATRTGERETVCVSAATGEGLDDLRKAVAARLSEALAKHRVRLLLPFGDAAAASAASQLRKSGSVLREVFTNEGTVVEAAAADAATAARLKKKFGLSEAEFDAAVFSFGGNRSDTDEDENGAVFDDGGELLEEEGEEEEEEEEELVEQV